MKSIHVYLGNKLASIIVHSDQTVLNAMNMMNKLNMGVAFVTNRQSGTLSGILTDGDIRRIMSQGGNLEGLLLDAVNAKPVSVGWKLSHTDAIEFMESRRVEYLPVVENGVLTAVYQLLPWQKKNETTAVIMAGGLGTRLKPLTDTTPKPLLPLGNEPILIHLIRRLAAQGVQDFIISVNYLANQIVSCLGDGANIGVNIRYVRETKRMGTGGALSLLDNDISDPIVCINGDILTDIDINLLIASHNKEKRLATMAVYDHEIRVPFGVIDYDEMGNYRATREKPLLTMPINTGIYAISRTAIAAIPKDEFFDLPSLFELLYAKGESVGTYHHRGVWNDIGTLKEYQAICTVYGDITDE